VFRRIYFARENPADFGVLSFWYRFGVAWGLVVIGLALWAFSAGTQIGDRRSKNCSRRRSVNTSDQALLPTALWIASSSIASSTGLRK
jgi:hypothetical protein